MASYNRVVIIGNLTRAPEIRHTTSGQAICQLGMAVNRKWKDAQGQDKEDVCFVDVTVWGKQGESCAKYLDKGSSALVEGRLQFDSWDDQATGAKRSKLSVVGENVRFLDKKSDNTQQSQNNASNGYSQPQQPRNMSADVPKTAFSAPDDAIPF